MCLQVPDPQGGALGHHDYPEALVKMQNLLQQIQGGAWDYSHAPRGWMSTLLVLAYTLSSEDLERDFGSIHEPTNSISIT